MNMNRVAEILKIEKECVERQDTPKCNRDCGNCDLLLPTEEVKQAYTLAIGCIEDTQSLLDKIRTEIENDWQLKKYPSSPFSCGLRRAIEIIDKYRGESI